MQRNKSMEENSFLIENKCFICNLVLYKNDIVYLDNNCKVEVHKSCKKSYMGSCPICGKNVIFENESKISVLIYTCLISSIFLIFLTAFICFFIIVFQHL